MGRALQLDHAEYRFPRQPASHGPRARHRARHPHPATRQLPRRRLARGAAVLRAVPYA